MRRTARRPGVVLLSAVAAVVGVLAAPAAPATAAPAAPAASAAPAAPAVPTRVAPTPGPAARVCPAATPGTVTCFAERRTDVTPKAAAAAPSGYGPADLRAAYAVPATGGSGVTVAAVVAHDYPTAADDLATYRARYGLPALTAGQFTKVNQSGQQSGYPSYHAGWAGEAALDVQMITATCPACRILLVEATDPSLRNVAAAAATAVRLGATYVSNSYGASDTGTGALAASYAASGVTFLAATGDFGYRAGAPSFPATSPGVIAVGGTSLYPTGSARGWRESAWARAGLGTGCSSAYAKPTFQNAVGTGCAGRAVADVSAVADPATGVAVYSSADGGWVVYGGTSAATPIVAGIAALAGTPGVTAANVYDSPGAFNDVTTGTTGSCGTVLCTAGVGWDGPTGLGTPVGTAGFAVVPLSCGGTPAAATSSGTAGGRYVPVTPVRVLDTRSDQSTLGQDTTRLVDLARQLPSGRGSAAVLNVTVTNPTASGFVTAFPAGATRPLASNLNTVPGLTRANQVTVALGPVSGGGSSGVVLYNSAGRADLVVDLLGYYTADGDTASALTYHPAAQPRRAVDTRTAGRALGNAGVPGRVCVTTSLAGSDGAAITGVAAVAVTLTAVSPAGPGYLKAWNGDAAAEPNVSSLNFAAGQTVPNAAVVPVSCLDAACGTVTFAVANRVSTSTQVLVDVVGVYAADPDGGLVLQPSSPRRVVDTRVGQGFGPIGQDSAAAVVVPDASVATAAAVNVTAVAPSQTTYLTVYGTTRPPTSNLNPVAGEVVAGAVVTGLGSGGVLRVYNGLGRTDVVVDVAGLFVPAPTG